MDKERRGYDGSWLSSMLFSYMSEPMSLANQRSREEKSLTSEDIFVMDPEDSPEQKRATFAETYKLTASIIKSLLKTYGWSFWISILQQLLMNLLQFVGPITIKLLLSFYSDESQETWVGYVIAAGVLVAFLLRSLLMNHGYDNVFYNITLNYSCIYGQVYAKILNMSESIKGEVSAGRILNFISSDSTFISEVLMMFHNLWIGPVNICVGVVLWYIELEWCALVGLGVIVVMLFFQLMAISAFIRNRIAHQKEADTRTKLLQEFLEGIRIIKYYAWERFALNKIDTIREKELGEMQYGLLLRVLHEFITNTIPVVVLSTMFILYSCCVESLTVSKTFTVISTLFLLRPIMFLFMTSLIMSLQAYASIGRLSTFFNVIGSFERYVEEEPGMEVGAISVEGGNFAWTTSETKAIAQEFDGIIQSRFDPKKPQADGGKPVEGESSRPSESSVEYRILQEIDLRIVPGELCAVVGEVGSGKSSLASAIIGEMIKLKGSVKLKGKIAYVPQTAWIVNGTLRDNIIMDKPYDEQKYHEVTRLCELREDFKTFEGKDLIEIGSKGINLSGGQKQRISIARALYSDSDIYIIDDCLSALDANVGKAIFNNVIRGALEHKTRFLATHATSLLKRVEKIVVIKKGRIIDVGNYEYLENNCREFHELIVVNREKKLKKAEEEKQIRKESAFKEDESKYGISSEEENTGKKQLIQKETQEIGNIKFANYFAIARYSSVWIVLLVVALFIVCQVLMLLMDWWAGVWGGDEYDRSNGYYIGVYVAVGAIQMLFNLCRGLTYLVLIISLARGTQMRLIWAILKAPLRWFDQTPIGRILNRACRDQAVLDNDIVWLVQGTLRFTVQLVGTLITIGSVLPYFFIEMAAIIIIYILLLFYSIQASRDCRRIESVSKSPIFSQYGETLDGLSSIRACGYSSMLDRRILSSISDTNEAYFMMTRCERWLNLRVSALGAFATFGAYVFAVVARDHDSVSESLIGLSISQSVSIITYIGLMLMMAMQLDTKMNAVERITEYIDSNPEEKDFDSPKPAVESWPDKGEIELSEVYFRYRPELKNVIHGLSLKINPKEKIGIAGRTGSGKSTITLGMLRIIEPFDMPEGRQERRIVIDGQDIEKIGLHVLRNHIAIIPQDPILFSGTIKSNLDPFRESTEEHDQEILEVLEKAKLLGVVYDKTKPTNPGQIASAPMKHSIDQLNFRDKEAIINCEVQERGGNFSMGEKQLLCIARALLRKPKILLMDEATASIDEATDKEIQQMVKTQFTNSTVITIAHRVNTIIEYDRIAVLSLGHLVELDTPSQLLRNQASDFTQMVRRQGEAFYQDMLVLADAHDSSRKHSIN